MLHMQLHVSVNITIIYGTQSELSEHIWPHIFSLVGVKAFLQ